MVQHWPIGPYEPQSHSATHGGRPRRLLSDVKLAHRGTLRYRTGCTVSPSLATVLATDGRAEALKRVGSGAAQHPRAAIARPAVPSGAQPLVGSRAELPGSPTSRSAGYHASNRSDNITASLQVLYGADCDVSKSVTRSSTFLLIDGQSAVWRQNRSLTCCLRRDLHPRHLPPLAIFKLAACEACAAASR